MCCFSRKVELVADTNIFARASANGRQFLVYSMRFKAGEALSMILPIPVPKGSNEDAIKFINLEKFADFFDELKAGFPEPPPPPSSGKFKDRADDKPLSKLAVVEVGSFIASFVSSIKDFARLDERFRLPAEVWGKLPQYQNWGFAVFQLKKGDMKVHPMAFEFLRALPKQIFFPTVHIHDGTVPEKATFDHMLYCQLNDEMETVMWEESPQPAELFMTNIEKAQGIVDPKGHCYRKALKGRYENKDVII